MSDPKVTGEVEIQLDQPRLIKFAHFSRFRLGRFSDQAGGGEFTYNNLLIYVWAMLPKAALKRFPDPEDLGEFITLDNVEDYFPKVLQAIKAGTDKPDDDEKKTP
jgi:hypothetical protein